MEKYEKPMAELILFDIKETIATEDDNNGDGIPDTGTGVVSDPFA